MLDNGIWSVDETDLGKAALSVDAGTEAIAGECWIIENYIEHHDIMIPSNTKQIEDAFNTFTNFTIHAPAGSYAEQYAKEHNIPFVAE